ncbi:MAG: hypothetical protein ACYTA5_25855 [Planctomycetota bacterium]
MLLYHRLRYGYRARLIPVGQGKYAIVDVDDYERLAKYKWHVCDNGYSSYAFRWSGGTKKRVWMHREDREGIDYGLLIMDYSLFGMLVARG